MTKASARKKTGMTIDPTKTKWIDLTKIPVDQLTDYHRELLRRGGVWLIVVVQRR